VIENIIKVIIRNQTRWRKNNLVRQHQCKNGHKYWKTTANNRQ